MESVQPLTKFPTGSHCQVLSLGTDAEWQRRLQCMGLRMGGAVEIFQSGTPGRPLVLICGNSRLVIDYSLGCEILAESALTGEPGLIHPKQPHLEVVSHE